MDKAEIQQLWDEIQANHAALQACPSHDFKPEGTRPFMSREVCSNCGGSVQGMVANWYRLGREHAIAARGVSG